MDKRTTPEKIKKTITVPSKNNTLFVDSNLNIKEMDLEIYEALKGVGNTVKCFPMGSRFIPGCKISEDTDFDYMFYVPERKLLDIHHLLWEKGFEVDGEDRYKNSDFLSYRKGKANFIMTSDKKLFESTRNATELCRFLKITDKDQRVKVYDFFRHTYAGLLCSVPQTSFAKWSSFENPFYLNAPVNFS